MLQRIRATIHMGVDLQQTDADADQRSQLESTFGVLNSALKVGHRGWIGGGLEDIQKTRAKTTRESDKSCGCSCCVDARTSRRKEAFMLLTCPGIQRKVHPVSRGRCTAV